MVALAHGTNDAQKTMGVISLALIANGSIAGRRRLPRARRGSSSRCATAIALGTYAGGWRIIKTLGTKVVEVRPPQGFGSETVAASVILASSHVGFPLSTTQVVSGAVAGSGVGRPGAVVNWLVARKIVVGWLLTLPVGGRRVGASSTRSSSCSAAASPARSWSASRCSIAAFLLWRANRAQPVEPEETVSEHPAFGARRTSRWRHDFAAVVDWGKLLEAAYVSAAFGIGVVLIGGARGGRVAARPGPPRRRSRRRDRPRRRHRRVRARPSPAPSCSASTS